MSTPGFRIVGVCIDGRFVEVKRDGDGPELEETGTGIGRWAIGLLERVAATLLVGVFGLEV